MARKITLIIFAVLMSPVFIVAFAAGNVFWLAHTAFYRALHFQRWLTTGKSAVHDNEEVK